MSRGCPPGWPWHGDGQNKQASRNQGRGCRHWDFLGESPPTCQGLISVPLPRSPVFQLLQLSLFLFKYLFGCTGSQLQHVGSLVAAREILVVPCEIQFFDQGLKPSPLHWEHRVLATRSPGKSQVVSQMLWSQICYPLPLTETLPWLLFPLPFPSMTVSTHVPQFQDVLYLGNNREFQVKEQGTVVVINSIGYHLCT